tara:strand:- start:3100 stop:3579 length:480 start_codon:yes stop_codon:yes gene_type:complete
MPNDENLAEENYLRIGKAAEVTGVTKRALRYYEEKGLLPPPSRLEGGFRLYSPEDIQRIKRIQETQELLGFSLIDIKEMLAAEDVKTEIRANWIKNADAAVKASAVRTAREVTLSQMALLEQKMEKMEKMHAHLAERLSRYDELLRAYSEELSKKAIRS